MVVGEEDVGDDGEEEEEETLNLSVFPRVLPFLSATFSL